MRHLLARGRVRTLDTRPTTSAQPVWAEILSGRPWYVMNCPGYGAPSTSLNDTQIVEERSLAAPLDLADGSSECPALSINMPLLAAKPSRIWLADGSLPTAISVSPTSLLARQPFRSYSPRPFTSAAGALLHCRQSVVAVLDSERHRLECARALMAEVDWGRCFLRITAFDLLLHLLGPGSLACGSLTVADDISNFVAELGRLVVETMDGGTRHLVIISPHSHTPCVARLNLGSLLCGGGFAAAAEQPAAAESVRLKRRADALATISGEGGTRSAADVERMTRLPSPRRCAPTSLAWSPVAGAVYMNRRSRFADGILTDAEAKDLSQQLFYFLESELGDSFRDRLTVWRRPIDSPAPELMVYVDGVEQCESEGAAIDRYHVPRSTHRSEGFCWLPASMDTDARDPLRPLDLHLLLAQALT